MTESAVGAAPPDPTFESIESELQAVVRKLEDPEVPLEARLRLHDRAVSLHQSLEALLEAARRATEEARDETPAPPETGNARQVEPYEVVRDRLTAIVNTLEGDELPLARVVELHGEARRLAARCEAILSAAQAKITRDPIPSDTTPDPPDAPPDDVPF